ncbi:hypothetical protein TNCT_549281 [Trichonephila clavata]|uniref:Uncharacterized protein n=1 Tax=Trichonephila clavata TaxID=2740835 RepID=A0A8X6KCI1_TRICU|nr:hypothetical protein TNCT_549281 [Trichonephila clavata]
MHPELLFSAGKPNGLRCSQANLVTSGIRWLPHVSFEAPYLPSLSRAIMLRSALSASPICRCGPRRSVFSPRWEVMPGYSYWVRFRLRTSEVTTLQNLRFFS